MLIKQLAFPWSDRHTGERQSHEEEPNWAEELVQHGLLGLDAAACITINNVIGQVPTYLLARVLRSQREDVDDPGKNIYNVHAATWA
jgi:hypothetical protein